MPDVAFALLPPPPGSTPNLTPIVVADFVDAPRGTSITADHELLANSKVRLALRAFVFLIFCTES